MELNKIYNMDCVEGMKNIADDYIAVCITDPPYNYEFIGHKWDAEEVKRRTERVKELSSTVVKNIPYGSGLAGGTRNKRWYERNRQNIIDYSKWIEEWGTELYRIMKPGGLVFVFNSTRTIAQVQVALENVGFYARDIMVWRRNSGIPKGLNVAPGGLVFVFNSTRTIAQVQVALENVGFYARDIMVWRRNSGIPKGLNVAKKLEKMGKDDLKKWEGWHSCLRNEWEAICIVQKPIVNNYIETLEKYHVGLFKAKNEEGFKSNIIEDIKRDKKDDFNIHATVKPKDLIKQLIELSVPDYDDNIVLDPFMGSGTTAVVAKEMDIKYIGFEVCEEYVEIANKRIKESLHKEVE